LIHANIYFEQDPALVTILEWYKWLPYQSKKAGAVLAILCISAIQASSRLLFKVGQFSWSRIVETLEVMEVITIVHLLMLAFSMQFQFTDSSLA
jgi:hypothetical protein